MKEFMRAYRWGIHMKLYMGIYTLALICVKGVVNLLQGSDQVGIWTLFQMMVVCFLLAVAESGLFPEDRELDRAALKRRTAVWALLANALFIGGALAFGWFAGVPAWGAAVLVLALEWGLCAMWVGRHVALKKDTQALNQNLKQFQAEQ